ncbi:MAG: hypothetical protein JXL97_03135 [Bacteroidales bacterium]|nr:hypothetical protein [Bacteroidales bacterium]
MINEVTKLYFEYLSSTNRKRLQMGHKLSQAANMLLEFNPPFGDDYFQRFFLMKKVANDLLQLTIDMQRSTDTKQAEARENYVKLAFNIAFEYCGRKADRELLPFVRHLLAIEKNNQEYLTLFRKCVEAEKAHLAVVSDLYKY